MKNVTNESFEEEVVNNENPVVVDFWAPWCGPCKVAMPKLQSMDEEFSEVDFTKVNVDEEGELAQEYKIQSIPTFLVFVGGQIQARIVADIAALREHLEPL